MMTAPWLTLAAAPGPSIIADSRACARSCNRRSSVLRTTASALAGTMFCDWSATQSAYQPGDAGRTVVKSICAAAACAWSFEMAPASTIAASTSRPRAAAASGLVRGLNRDGARGNPASTAACHNETLRAETPKYICDAASMPQAPDPR